MAPENLIKKANVLFGSIIRKHNKMCTNRRGFLSFPDALDRGKTHQIASPATNCGQKITIDYDSTPLVHNSTIF